VLHVCGKGNLAPALEGTPGYRQFEYLHAELPHAYAAADALISRAGSNSLSELLALRKPALLIPYPATASRGDQIENARALEARGLARVLPQDRLTPETLAEGIEALFARRGEYIAAMEGTGDGDGTQAVLAQIERVAEGR
jgi:UDP-N-acetylglucosamine--N-acetylmuramyl-(pentapeptide) pyrophosphoryl-undecaprenol N-acetylglucosamine transferase